MSDDSNKVISIFQRHRRGEEFHFEVEEGGELIISPDGFNYFSAKQDCDGAEEERALLELADAKHYIVKMIESHESAMRTNNYYVPGGRLQEFLLSLPNRPGKIVEIKQFIPDHMA